MSRTAFAACCSGVALATVCGLLWLLPRLANQVVETLPDRQSEAALREVWTASQVEGVLMRIGGDIELSDARLAASYRFDEAMRGAARVHPDPERSRTVGRLTASMRQLAHLEQGALTVATLAAERDRQLAGWSREAESHVFTEVTDSLRALVRLADVATVGGLLALVMSLWVSATIMWRIEEEVPPPYPHPPTGDDEDDTLGALRAVGPLGIDTDPELLDPPLLAVVDLNVLVEEVIELLAPLAAHRGHRLEADVGPGLETFVVDPEQLGAVLEELVEGPLRTSHPGHVTLRARREGRGVVISLVHRVNPHDIPTAPRRRGTVLLHDGVEALGGRLWWSADPGDGVRAALWIPDRRFVDGRIVGSVLP